ncbi:MAG: hypothetical protein WA001_03380 [Patescibacteria group bacterium]
MIHELFMNLEEKARQVLDSLSTAGYESRQEKKSGEGHMTNSLATGMMESFPFTIHETFHES